MGNVIWHKTLRMLKFHPIPALMKTYSNFKKLFLVRFFWIKYIFRIKYRIPILDLVLLPKNSVPFEGLYSSSFCFTMINRGSYMSAHVLMNLLNEVGKRDKMRG